MNYTAYNYNDIVAQHNNQTIHTANKARLGSYKLSSHIIKRMMPKMIKVHYKGKTTWMKNITDKELTLLLYLAQICTDTGNVDNLSYKELTSNSSFTKRLMCEKSFYNALAGLSKKNYISCIKNNRTYDIMINDNSFTCSNDDKKGYVNINRNEFLAGTKQYDYFNTLPLYNKKLFLYLLAAYAPARGFFVCLSTIKSLMSIKLDATIYGYIQNLQKIIGNDLHFLKNGRRVKASIKHQAPKMNSNSGIYDSQPTWFRRHISHWINNHNISYNHTYLHETDELLLAQLHGIVATFVNLNINDMITVIKHIMLEVGNLSASTLYQIRSSFNKA